MPSYSLNKYEPLGLVIFTIPWESFESTEVEVEFDSSNGRMRYRRIDMTGVIAEEWCGADPLNSDAWLDIFKERVIWRLNALIHKEYICNCNLLKLRVTDTHDSKCKK